MTEIFSNDSSIAINPFKNSHKRISTIDKELVLQPHREYADILDSIRDTLDKMLPNKKHIRRSSNTTLESSTSGEDDDKDIPDQSVCPSIQTLLNHLDLCIVKLNGNPPFDEGSIYNELESNKQTSINSVSSTTFNNDISPTSEDKGFFNSTFGRRKSNLILPMRDRQGSIASIATVSTYNSTSASSPKLASTANALSHITVEEASIGSTLKGYLSKLFVTNPSFLARKSWKQRYFILNGTTIFRFKTDSKSTVCSEIFPLTSTCLVCVNDSFPSKKFVIQVTESKGNNTMYLLAETSQELSTWLSAIKEAIARARFENQTLPPSPGEDDSFSMGFETRRSSSQTLPLSFQVSELEAFASIPNRISRANSQPAIQTAIKASNLARSSLIASPNPLIQNSTPSTPSITNASPIFGKSNSGRLRTATNPRIPSLNGSRRPSLAPLQEDVDDNSDFLKEVLEPINHSAFKGSVLGLVGSGLKY